MTFDEARAVFFEKLGTHQIMALAACEGDRVSVRNVSVLIYDGKLWFKTDKNFRKTKQLLKNPYVALCVRGVQVEGIAANKGLVAEEDGGVFARLYEQYWATSYNAYPHTESEILIEVTPTLAEIWDQREDNFGFQITLDFENGTALVEDYD